MSNLKAAYNAIAQAVQQQLTEQYPAEKTYVSLQEMAEKSQNGSQKNKDKR